MRAVLIALLAAGCGRIGFDASSTPPDDGALPDADVVRCGSQMQPLPAPTAVANLCRGETWFGVTTVPAASLSVTVGIPDGLSLGSITVELASPDGTPIGGPVWNPSSVTADGIATQAGVQLVHVVSDQDVKVPLSLATTAPLGAAHYIAADGDNAGDGSVDHPWQTWPFALRQLAPGDTLIVRDGTWTDRASCAGLAQPCLQVAPIAETGNGFLQDAELFDADCFAGVQAGTPELPITVVAEHQRRAFSASTGRNYAYRVAGCANWILDGLVGEGADTTAKGSDTVGRVQKLVYIVDQSPNFLGRHLLGSHPNRCANDWVFGVGDSPGAVIEDSEAYEFSRHGFFAADVSAPGVTFRRVYANGRGLADVSCSMPDTYPGPDDGLVCYHYQGAVPTCTVDNAIAEQVGNGFYDAGAETWRITGSIALDTIVGFESSPGDDGAQGAGKRDFTNIVSVRSNLGVRNHGNSMSVVNATLVGAMGTSADNGAGVQTYPGTPVANRSTFTNVLALDSARVGFDFQQTDSVASYCSAASAAGTPSFLPGDGNIGDDTGQVQRSLTTQPTRVGDAADRCLVYVPADDALAASGKSGAAIGASIVHRVEQGAATPELLWNQRTGAFPCGAIVPGLNDVPGASCMDVHERLHVGTPGCPIPK